MPLVIRPRPSREKFSAIAKTANEARDARKKRKAAKKKGKKKNPVLKGKSTTVKKAAKLKPGRLHNRKLTPAPRNQLKLASRRPKTTTAKAKIRISSSPRRRG